MQSLGQARQSCMQRKEALCKVHICQGVTCMHRPLPFPLLHAVLCLHRCMQPFCVLGRFTCTGEAHCWLAEPYSSAAQLHVARFRCPVKCGMGD